MVVAVPEGLPLAVTLTYESFSFYTSFVVFGCIKLVLVWFQPCVLNAKDDAR